LRTLQRVNGRPSVWPGSGHRDDHVNVVLTDQAGTASRPPRVQRGQALAVKPVDHVSHRVLIGGHQPGDRRHQRARRRRHDDHRPPDPDRTVLAAPHDLLQPPAFLISQPTRPHRLSHHISRHSISSP
jgi:hypothetical protein